MKQLENAIIQVLKESRGIYENHDEISKHLNSATGGHVGSETANFVHRKGKNEDHPSGAPEHSSPVKDHYYHQGEFAGHGDDEHEHHITVSHHEDGTASVQHSAARRKWSNRDQDYNESIKHHEKHFSNLSSAIDHVKKLKTPE